MIRLSHTTNINRISVNPSARRTEIGIALRKPLPKPRATLAQVMDKGVIAFFKWLTNTKTLI